LVDIENLTAGSGADQLTGNGLANVLRAVPASTSSTGVTATIRSSAARETTPWTEGRQRLGSLHAGSVCGPGQPGRRPRHRWRRFRLDRECRECERIGVRRLAGRQAAANELQGWTGDQLFGLARRSAVRGGGSDTSRGGRPDMLEGGAGLDTLIGGSEMTSCVRGDSDCSKGRRLDALDGGDGIDWPTTVRSRPTCRLRC